MQRLRQRSISLSARHLPSSPPSSTPVYIRLPRPPHHLPPLPSPPPHRPRSLPRRFPATMFSTKVVALALAAAFLGVNAQDTASSFASAPPAAGAPTGIPTDVTTCSLGCITQSLPAGNCSGMYVLLLDQHFFFRVLTRFSPRFQPGLELPVHLPGIPGRRSKVPDNLLHGCRPSCRPRSPVLRMRCPYVLLLPLPGLQKMLMRSQRIPVGTATATSNTAAATNTSSGASNSNSGATNSPSSPANANSPSPTGNTAASLTSNAGIMAMVVGVVGVVAGAGLVL